MVLVTVYKKEVRENLRDRRSLFNSVLLGPILFPILFIGLAYFASSKQQESVEKVLEVPVVGAEHAPNLVSFLEQQGVIIQTAPEDPEAIGQEPGSTGHHSYPRNIHRAVEHRKTGGD